MATWRWLGSQKGQNYVHVIVEWPQRHFPLTFYITLSNILTKQKISLNFVALLYMSFTSSSENAESVKQNEEM